MNSLSKQITSIFLALLPLTSFGVQSIYCPGNQGYIKVGMTTQEVVKACGIATAKQESKTPLTEKVPVIQLIYTNLNTGAVFSGYNSVYKMWSLPSGSLGLTLQVDIIDNKVSGINVQGSSNNATSLCKNVAIQMNDPIDKVYANCGSPGSINQTYIDKPIKSQKNPEIWYYQADRYQPLITLTILDGRLVSIN